MLPSQSREAQKSPVRIGLRQTPVEHLGHSFSRFQRTSGPLIHFCYERKLSISLFNYLFPVINVSSVRDCLYTIYDERLEASLLVIEVLNSSSTICSIVIFGYS